MKKPSRLKTGDTIGISSFAWLPKDMGAIDRGIARLEAMGFKVREGACTRRPCTPTEKLTDLHAFFEDPDVKAIISVRGGWGTLKYLPLVDMELIYDNPKIFMGFSDITTLLVPIYTIGRIVTFYGPMVASNFSKDEPYSVDMFLKVVSGQKVKIEAENPVVISPGKATGRLVGGCLSLLVTLPGIPYDYDPEGTILFFEDVGEPPYRVDRMLTYLKLAGKFWGVRGIAIGKFNVEDEKGVIEVFKEHFEEMDIPVLYGLKFGHIPNIATLPIGVNAEIDTQSASLKLLEPAVEV